MSGGIPTGARSRCALAMAAGLLGAMLITPLSAELALADEPAPTAPADADCLPRADEKSIVVESGKAPVEDLDVATATDQDSGDLEPIANVSEYEPDLAEGASDRLEHALVPTLADPPPTDEPGFTPATPADGAPRVAEAPTMPTPAADAEPAASPVTDDVCIEDAPSASAPESTPEAAHTPASFNGVTPGVTTRAEVLSQWSNPQEPEVGGETLTYQLEGFPSVVVGFAGDVVSSVRVTLEKPAVPERLVAKLGLSAFRPSVAVGDDGFPTSTTFPERGVTLEHRADAAMATDEPSAAALPVAEIVVRPIDAASFVERARRAAPAAYAHRLADLETALTFDPTSTAVMRQLSEQQLAIGSAAAAEELAAKAVNLDPADDASRLQWARSLHALARYDRAVEETSAVLEGDTAAPIVRAAALEQMGLLASLGSKEVQERAIPLHNKAIALADSLAAGDDPAVRAAANEVLLGAHLAIAEQLAAGQWQGKDAVVGQWIERASALAEQMIASGEGDVSLRLRVALSALQAGGRLQPPIDPQLWVAEAEQAAADYEATIDGDSHARDAMNWQLGQAYCQAGEIQHRRGESDLAIRYGELADATLSPLAEKRGELPDTRYALGNLYFQIGAVHAVHKQDHTMACQWYDRAAELLLEPAPFTRLANPGRHGDALVSMGVSYWEVGQRDRAYELTNAGVEIVNQGVADGLLAADALAVPQGNLQAMARALGKPGAAAPAEQGVQVAQKSRTAKRSGSSRPATRTAARSTSTSATRRR